MVLMTNNSGGNLYTNVHLKIFIRLITSEMSNVIGESIQGQTGYGFPERKLVRWQA